MQAREQVVKRRVVDKERVVEARHRRPHPRRRRLARVWIIPSLNPDGAEFDVAGGSYALWRKNRQPNAGSSAVGTDLNRNWSWQWGCCAGSSAAPSSETFRGAGGVGPQGRHDGHAAELAGHRRAQRPPAPEAALPGIGRGTLSRHDHVARAPGRQAARDDDRARALRALPQHEDRRPTRSPARAAGTAQALLADRDGEGHDAARRRPQRVAQQARQARAPGLSRRTPVRPSAARSRSPWRPCRADRRTRCRCRDRRRRGRGRRGRR